MQQDTLKKAAETIRHAEALLITAGAGMGVDSGLPDFRGNEGFWRAYPPIAKLNISFVEMANPAWFVRDPTLAWGFYGHRFNLYRETKPHAGFAHLLTLCRQKPGGYFVFTSNVDGHFQKAGFEDSRMEECHGSINYFQCTVPCSGAIWDGSEASISVNVETFRAAPPLPQCPNCGNLARPNVLMFGDWNWIEDRTRAQSKRFANWLQSVYRQSFKLAIIEIGAGKAVPTVRNRSEYVASHLNGTLIRMNPRDADAPHGHLSIPLNGLAAIEQILGVL